MIDRNAGGFLLELFLNFVADLALAIELAVLDESLELSKMLVNELLRQRNVLGLIPRLGVGKPKGSSQGGLLVIIEHTREPL